MFRTEKYDGRKSIIITTTTVMGGRNIFLGVAYLVVGGICILLGVIFLATHLIRPRYPPRIPCICNADCGRKLGDHTYLSWNNAPSSGPHAPGTARGGERPGAGAAVASGRDM